MPVLLALLLLGGCGGSETAEISETIEEQSGTEDIHSPGESLAATYAADDVFAINAMLDSSFNPYRLTSAWNRVVDMLVYENLVELDASFEAQPNLITAWSSEDGLTWNFSVDTTRRFHSGDVLNSVDCVYSVDTAMDSDLYKERFADVEEVSTLNEGTFQVKLKSCNWLFYTLLNIPCIERDTYYNDIPGGSGPYKFSASGDMLLLDENYPKAAEMPLLRIYLKQYTASSDILQAFENSQLDLVINDPTSLSNLGYSKTNIVRYVDSTNMHYLGYNMQSMTMSQTAIRAAMTYVIDRSTIVSSYMAGAGVSAALPIHPYNSLYPEDMAEEMNYSPEKFLQSLKDFGMDDVDGDGELELFSGATALKQDLVFLVCSESAAKVSAAKKIADAMEDAGLSVSLRTLDYEDYIKALEEGEFDLYYGEIKLRGDWDLSEMFTTTSSTDSDTMNYGRISDQMLLSCYAQLLSSPEEGRTAAVTALCEYWRQSAPLTVICFEKSEVLYHRGVISGMNPTQDNLFTAMENWEVNLAAE